MAEKGEETLYDSKETKEWKNHTFRLLSFSISFSLFFLIIFFLLLFKSIPNISIFDYSSFILFIIATFILGIYLPYEIINRKSLKISKKYIFIPNSKEPLKIDIIHIKSVYYFEKVNIFVIYFKNGYKKILSKDNIGNPDRIINILKNKLNVNVKIIKAPIPIGLTTDEKSLIVLIKEYNDYKSGLVKPSLMKRIFYKI